VTVDTRITQSSDEFLGLDHTDVFLVFVDEFFAETHVYGVQHVSVDLDKEIIRFDIAMDDSFRMNVIDYLQHLLTYQGDGGQ